MSTSQMNGCWHYIELQLSKTLGKSLHFTQRKPVSGGCINQAWKVTDNEGGCWFIKTNTPNLLEMFRAEADGLNEIEASNSIGTPKVIAYGNTPNLSYLILQYIDLQDQINQALLGSQLAQMHQFKSNNNQFGWKRNNTIGSTKQSNQFNGDWVVFWKNERLCYQLGLALNNAYPSKAYEKGLELSENLALFFTDYQPKPSLLHGDLWGGNCSSDENANPIIFDPAVYYGDRETDIAMTELFGGFSSDFYTAYNTHYPLDAGYKVRKTLYNLYHILNHFNLFGGGYASQAENMTNKLLSEIK